MVTYRVCGVQERASITLSYYFLISPWNVEVKFFWPRILTKWETTLLEGILYKLFIYIKWIFTYVYPPIQKARTFSALQADGIFLPNQNGPFRSLFPLVCHVRYMEKNE